MERCDFRTCRECSCADDQCRVQNIGIIRKHDTMAGIFTPKLTDYLALIAFCALSIAIGLTTYTLLQNEQQFQIARKV